MTGTLYRRVVRPLLFRQGGGDPEIAHERALSMAARVQYLPMAGLRSGGHATASRTVFGIDFPNPVGLAAGMDKDGVAVRAWELLGFGFVEVGTVTALPQSGNDRPRLFRLTASEAIVNRMGFNNAGAEQLAATLTKARSRAVPGVPIGISLGKSKVTPVEQAVGDYLASMRAVHQHADYLAVNVSSPNTPGLRSLQDRRPLDELLGALVQEAAALASPEQRGGRPVPVLVKISPDLSDQAIGDVLQVCADRGVAGIIATNTTLSRDGVHPDEVKLATEAGGLSGAPLAVRARRVVGFVAAHCDLPVIGVGGILTAADALALFDAGASLVQLYTGFIYRGSALIHDIVGALSRRQAVVAL